MIKKLKLSRIRTRLVLAYLGILIGGFGVLAIVTGQQVSSAARVDYEQRLQNEIRLIAQGLRPYFADGVTSEGTLTDSALTDTLDEKIAEYEAQTGGTLRVFDFTNIGGRENPPPQDRSVFPEDNPEIEVAMNGSVAVFSRYSEDGQRQVLFTAAPVIDAGRRPTVLVQLSVPLDNLESIVRERWLYLGGIFALVMLVAVIAALLLARSIIEPLTKLRDSAVQLATGDFSHRIHYARDDEIGEVAVAFNGMAFQVESMLNEQRAFASNTSHELRTPLTTIRLRTEALRHDRLDDATSAQYIREIDDEVRRMGTLIEDLTLLSRLEAGRVEIGKDEIDLSRFTANIKQQMQQRASAKNIQLFSDVPTNIVPINASLNHLTIVFRNLLDNAIKYTQDGGEIHLNVQEAENGVIRVTIEDNGIGITPEQKPHLFERFYRTDESHSRDIPGTGLGLSIVKSIVETYGGKISIESKGENTGTTVILHFPQSTYASAD